MKKIKLIDIINIEVGDITIMNYHYIKTNVEYLMLICKFLKYVNNKYEKYFLHSVTIGVNSISIIYEINGNTYNSYFNYDLIEIYDGYLIFFDNLQMKEQYTRQIKINTLNVKN